MLYLYKYFIPFYGFHYYKIRGKKVAMKKLLSGLLVGTLMVGSAGLFGCKKQAEYTPLVATEQTTLATVQDGNVSDNTVLPVSEQAEQVAQVTDQTVSTGVEIDYLSPLVTLRADPFLCKSPLTGKYYFTGSYPDYDRIDLRCADTVNGIASAKPEVIWTWENTNVNHVWAPELHYVMGQWVIYYAAGEPGNAWDIRCRALRCKGNDPMKKEDWENVGQIQHAKGDNLSFQTGMNLDMTVFENKGRWYVIWAEKHDNVSRLFLAELETPFKLKSAPIMLTEPTYPWETKRERVNEGPAVLKNAGKIFVSYSAAATGYEYCMGLLEINEDADILDTRNWKKRSEPVFQTNEELEIYGPGHNSFVKGDNDEWLCILHFRDYKNIIGGDGNSLYDHNRHAHVMKLKFDEEGAPVFHFDADDLFNTPFVNDQADRITG